MIKIAEYSVAKKITMQQAFDELLKDKEIFPEFVCDSEMDGDLITGNLREQGLKIDSINENLRRKNNNEKL